MFEREVSVAIYRCRGNSITRHRIITSGLHSTRVLAHKRRSASPRRPRAAWMCRHRIVVLFPLERCNKFNTRRCRETSFFHLSRLCNISRILLIRSRDAAWGHVIGYSLDDAPRACVVMSLSIIPRSGSQRLYVSSRQHRNLRVRCECNYRRNAGLRRMLHLDRGCKHARITPDSQIRVSCHGVY